MDTEKKRALEADVMEKMIAIYCRGKKHAAAHAPRRRQRPSARTAAASSPTPANALSGARACM